MDTSFQHGFPSNPVKRVATHTREVGMTCSVWLTPSASVTLHSVSVHHVSVGEHQRRLSRHRQQHIQLRLGQGVPI